jgi:hypothetical protein
MAFDNEYFRGKTIRKCAKNKIIYLYYQNEEWFEINDLNQ